MKTRWGNDALAVLLGFTLIGSGEQAFADVRIVSQVEVTGMPRRSEDALAPKYPQTVITYYKGDKVRVEVADGPVTIYDPLDDKVYTLDPSKKTYSIVSFIKMMDPKGGLTGPMADRMKIEIKVDARKQDEKKTAADKEARRWTVTGSVKMTPDFSGFSGGRGGGFPGGGFPGGGRRPGGGFPGGGREPGGGRGSGGSLPSMEMTGEYWMTDTVPLTASSKNKIPLLPSFAQTLRTGPVAGGLLKSLTEKMAKDNAGFPLSSRVTLKMPIPQRMQEEGSSSGQEPIMITTEIKSITEETLDDRIFQVPEDYEKVDPAPSPSPFGQGRRRER